MNQTLSLILIIIAFLSAFAHLLGVVLLKAKKLKLRDLYLWLYVTIFSVLIAIILLVYQITINEIPIFPIMAIIGLILLSIALIKLIRKFK